MWVHVHQSDSLKEREKTYRPVRVPMKITKRAIPARNISLERMVLKTKVLHNDLKIRLNAFPNMPPPWPFL
jgi:hypothetical protein